MTTRDEGIKPDTSCPFCKIIAKGDDANIVRRWEDCIAISPLDPATLGHTLLIPKVHVATIWEISELTAQRLTRCTLEIARALKHVVHLDGLNVIQSNGSAATQTVPHLHIHLVPRYDGDAMGDIWPEDSAVPEGSTHRVTSDLATALAEAQG